MATFAVIICKLHNNRSAGYQMQMTRVKVITMMQMADEDNLIATALIRENDAAAVAAIFCNKLLLSVARKQASKFAQSSQV